MPEVSRENDFSYADKDIPYWDNNVVFCGLYNAQWGHFLLESILRLWFYIENNEIDVDYLVFVTRTEDFTAISGNQREFLKLLGIIDKVRIINAPIKCKTVIVPENSYYPHNYYNELYIRTIDSVINNAVKQSEDLNLPKHKKIFLSRSRFSRAVRMELGTKALDQYFEYNDYKVIFPEQIKLSELIWYLQNAEKVATTCGTIAHNSIFCKNNTDIVILERSSAVNRLQIEIDSFRHLNTTYVDSNYMIFPVCQAIGPCIFAYNDYFKAYAEDNAEKMPPKSIFLKSPTKQLGMYYSRFFTKYRLSPGITYQFQLKEMSLYYDAYFDSLRSVKPYINGIRCIGVLLFCIIDIIKTTFVWLFGKIKKKLKK